MMDSSNCDDDIYENYDPPTLEVTNKSNVNYGYTGATNNYHVKTISTSPAVPNHSTVQQNNSIPQRPTTADLSFGRAVEPGNIDKCELEYNELFNESHGKLHEVLPQVSDALNKMYDLVFKYCYVILSLILAPVFILVYAFLNSTISAMMIWIVTPLLRALVYPLTPISECLKSCLRMFFIPCVQSCGYYFSMIVFRKQSLPTPTYDKTFYV